MSFDKYRDPALEQALIDYAIKKTGDRDGFNTKCVISNALIKDDNGASLKEVGAFLESQLGRKLKADDFCLLSKNPPDSQSIGVSVLTFPRGADRFELVAAIIKDSATVFSADALLLANECFSDKASALTRLKERGKLDALFDPDLWSIDPQPLYDLQSRVSDVEILQKIKECLTKVEEERSIPLDSTLRRDALLGGSGSGSPFRFSRAWDQFGAIQKILMGRGEALTWRDLFDTKLPDGMPLIAKAAQLGKLADVSAALPADADGTIGKEDLDRPLPDGSMISSALAETGHILPVLRAMGLSHSEIAEAASSLTETQRENTGLNAVILRRQLRNSSGSERAQSQAASPDQPQARKASFLESLIGKIS